MARRSGRAMDMAAEQHRAPAMRRRVNEEHRGVRLCRTSERPAVRRSSLRLRTRDLRRRVLHRLHGSEHIASGAFRSALCDGRGQTIELQEHGDSRVRPRIGRAPGTAMPSLYRFVHIHTYAAKTCRPSPDPSISLLRGILILPEILFRPEIFLSVGPTRTLPLVETESTQAAGPRLELRLGVS